MSFETTSVSDWTDTHSRKLLHYRWLGIERSDPPWKGKASCGCVGSGPTLLARRLSTGRYRNESDGRRVRAGH